MGKMKARIRPQMTSSEQKAMEMEIRRQLSEFDKKHTLELDSLILWSLHEQLGFGPKRLKRFYEQFHVILDELSERYEMDTNSDKIWLCTHKLKEYGIDIAEWDAERQERKANERVQKK